MKQKHTSAHGCRLCTVYVETMAGGGYFIAFMKWRWCWHFSIPISNFDGRSDAKISLCERRIHSRIFPSPIFLQCTYIYNTHRAFPLIAELLAPSLYTKCKMINQENAKLNSNIFLPFSVVNLGFCDGFFDHHRACIRTKTTEWI